jgi:hypothetical protein
MRSLGLVFLCFCLATSGMAAAEPMTGTAMESTASPLAIDHDCPDMAGAAALSSVHDGIVPDQGMNPDCCQGGGCKCAIAHVTLVGDPPSVPSQPLPTTTLVATGSSDYASPALARLVRPPIS